MKATVFIKRSHDGRLLALRLSDTRNIVGVLTPEGYKHIREDHLLTTEDLKIIQLALFLEPYHE